ncbi:hypothetical protein MAPG_01174 [Magnaporthiopsis poae ATCC 64411]|uniref:Uncharacterized protein n=1 Tax=Magnaporthiopsis poae (strain ATCC 64411 / 73-15) TaxID=644358 RepID=A0A0C4DN02_MAGP6|nr:hypothetical protein MAPG_01174 [Magnaporthiopsis poae ATCC 64411]
MPQAARLGGVYITAVVRRRIISLPLGEGVQVMQTGNIYDSKSFLPRSLDYLSFGGWSAALPRAPCGFDAPDWFLAVLVRTVTCVCAGAGAFLFGLLVWNRNASCLCRIVDGEVERMYILPNGKISSSTAGVVSGRPIDVYGGSVVATVAFYKAVRPFLPKVDGGSLSASKGGGLAASGGNCEAEMGLQADE